MVLNPIYEKSHESYYENYPRKSMKYVDYVKNPVYLGVKNSQ